MNSALSATFTPNFEALPHKPLSAEINEQSSQFCIPGHGVWLPVLLMCVCSEFSVLFIFLKFLFNCYETEKCKREACC